MRRLLPLTAALLALASPAAFADGDPASDILVAQDVYYPYQPKTSTPVANALNALLKKTKAAGYPVKVALIEAPADLGAYPNLFNDPQRYATLLASEINFNSKPRLLVVFPSGFAGDNLGEGVDAALSGLKVDAEQQSDGLAKAAMVAVAKLASANGHPTAVPAIARSSGTEEKQSTDRKTPSVFLYGGPALLVALVIGGLLWTGRRKRAEE